MEKDLNSIVSEVVRLRRVSLGKSQASVAAACGLCRSGYGHLENGRIKWTADVMGAVFKELGINLLILDEQLNIKHVGYIEELEYRIEELNILGTFSINQQREYLSQIEKLQSELNEYKEKAILWDNLKTGDKLNSLVGGDSKFCEKVDKDKIKRLEAELITKDDAIEILKGIIEELRGYKTEVLDLTTTKTRLQSELSELKAKHKEELPKKNFHGGCVGCIVQQTYGISNCAKCTYANKFPNDLPDLGIRPSIKPDINPGPRDMGLIQ